jgi:DNA-binding GntR family transcriptional regulator
VREALRILHFVGLVDLISCKGAYVTQPSIEEIHDFFEVMSVLEGICPRLAASRMTKEDINKIEKHIAVLKSTSGEGITKHILKRITTFI